MTEDKEAKAGQQKQDSRQSGQQGDAKPDSGRPVGGAKSRPGIGSSQGQDRGSPDEQQERRPSAGTPDIERGSGGGGDIERGASGRESLVQDPTGAYKERP